MCTHQFISEHSAPKMTQSVVILLQRCLEAGMLDHVEKVDAISTSAQKQHGLKVGCRSRGVDHIAEEWSSININHTSLGYPIYKPIDTAYQWSIVLRVLWGFCQVALISVRVLPGGSPDDEEWVESHGARGSDLRGSPFYGFACGNLQGVETVEDFADGCGTFQVWHPSVQEHWNLPAERT